jgi:hypothetical protein
MPWDTEEVIRICLPGIDNGSAIDFEARMGSKTRDDCEKLLPVILDNLSSVHLEQ